jgi:MarR family.
MDKHMELFEGSPATKFVLHIIKNSIKIDQGSLISATGLSRRTVQNALTELIDSGLIQENTDIRDLRRKIYSFIR